MGKRIMVLAGSPRKNGNTNTVATWFVEGAREAGADVEWIDVPQLESKFGGCVACMGCQKSEKYECAVKDEVQPVLARIPDADVLVFATPTYFFGPTAQIKSLLDRMFSLIKYNEARGEYDHHIGHLKIGLIATAGGGIQPGLRFIDDTFKTIAGFTGAGFQSLLVPNAPRDPAEMKDNRDLQERAKAFGRTLAS